MNKIENVNRKILDLINNGDVDPTDLIRRNHEAFNRYINTCFDWGLEDSKVGVIKYLTEVFTKGIEYNPVPYYEEQGPWDKFSIIDPDSINFIGQMKETIDSYYLEPTNETLKTLAEISKLAKKLYCCRVNPQLIIDAATLEPLYQRVYISTDMKIFMVLSFGDPEIDDFDGFYKASLKHERSEKGLKNTLIDLEGNLKREDPSLWEGLNLTLQGDGRIYPKAAIATIDIVRNIDKAIYLFFLKHLNEEISFDIFSNKEENPSI